MLNAFAKTKLNLSRQFPTYVNTPSKDFLEARLDKETLYVVLSAPWSQAQPRKHNRVALRKIKIESL